MDAMRKLRAVDLYRSIPKDLTEATQLGGVVSVVCIGTLLLLFMMVRHARDLQQ